MPAPMMTICARMAVVLEEKARVLHVVCEFNETAEPTRAALIKSQRQRQRGWKLYSFHAPEVECIIYEGMRIVGLPEG
jgi:hypothetical protein